MTMRQDFGKKPPVFRCSHLNVHTLGYFVFVLPFIVSWSLKKYWRLSLCFAVCWLNWTANQSCFSSLALLFRRATERGRCPECKSTKGMFAADFSAEMEQKNKEECEQQGILTESDVSSAAHLAQLLLLVDLHASKQHNRLINRLIIDFYFIFLNYPLQQKCLLQVSNALNHLQAMGKTSICLKILLTWTQCFVKLQMTSLFAFCHSIPFSALPARCLSLSLICSMKALCIVVFFWGVGAGRCMSHCSVVVVVVVLC